MNYLLDTNILVYYLTKPSLLSEFERTYQPLSNENLALISIVTEAEIKSIAVQRGWGEKKMKSLDELLSCFLIVPIETRRQVSTYTMIDAYSQGRHPNHQYPPGFSSKNMGKNDIWIATTVIATVSKLVTNDNDFDHLDGLFIDVIKPF